MHPSELAVQLLHESVVHLGIAAPSQYDGEPAWRIVLDEEIGLDVEYDESAQRLVVSGVIGPIADPDRSCMFEILLRYNFLWAQTAGVRMALGGQGEVVALIEASLANLDAQRLTLLLANFGDILRRWRELVNASADRGSAGHLMVEHA